MGATGLRKPCVCFRTHMFMHMYMCAHVCMCLEENPFCKSCIVYAEGEER